MSQSASSNLLTRFLIISDTHNFQFTDNAGTANPFRVPIPKVDVLLHCGDLTHYGGIDDSYQKALQMLGSIDAELKLVIAGNHDVDLDKTYCKPRLSEEKNREAHKAAIRTMTGPRAAQAGVTYLEEGTYTFTLKNGVTFTIYASPYSPEFCNWAFATGRSFDRYNKPHQYAPHHQAAPGARPADNPIPDSGVDIVMTHGPPKGVLDECPSGSAGCEHLLHAMKRVRPLVHCFGHIHEGHGAFVMDWAEKEREQMQAGSAQWSRMERDDFDSDGEMENEYPEPTPFGRIIQGQQTLMVNAAIMTGGMEMEPKNAPWIVDLDLARRA